MDGVVVDPLMDQVLVDPTTQPQTAQAPSRKRGRAAIDTSESPRRSKRLKDMKPPYTPGAMPGGMADVQMQGAMKAHNMLDDRHSACKVITDLIDAQSASPVQLKDTDADLNEFLKLHCAQAEVQGHSYVRSWPDERARPARTLGRFDTRTDRVGRGVTPDPLVRLPNDDRGHGFPQNAVVDGDQADKAEHMYPESWFVNQVTTREIERYGEKLASGGDRGVFKERVAEYPDDVGQRPSHFRERMFRRRNSGNFEQLAAIRQDNPTGIARP